MTSTLQGWEGGLFKADTSGFHSCELLHFGGYDVMAMN
jgi:hypothetical protein